MLTSYVGGAIYAEGSKLQFKGQMTFQANAAEDSGGAVYMVKAASLVSEAPLAFGFNRADQYGGTVHTC